LASSVATRLVLAARAVPSVPNRMRLYARATSSNPERYRARPAATTRAAGPNISPYPAFVYRFWVLIHLVGVAGFLAAHGVSMFALFAVRAAEGDRERILEWCEASKRTTLPMYVAFALLLLGGVAAGIDGSLFAQGWLLGSLVLLVLLTVLMSLVASPHMKRLREGCTRWADGSYTMSDEELRVALAGPATMITASTGGIGLLVILYLMVFKPGT
jgi:Predicted integral membrane protein (DUF2269)